MLEYKFDFVLQKLYLLLILQYWKIVLYFEKTVVISTCILKMSLNCTLQVKKICLRPKLLSPTHRRRTTTEEKAKVIAAVFILLLWPHLSWGKGTGCYHKENIEDGRADDGADADIADGDEDANDGGEELGGWAAGRHHRGAGHIRRDAKFLWKSRGRQLICPPTKTTNRFCGQW